MNFKSKVEILNSISITSVVKYLFFVYLAFVVGVGFIEVAQKEHISTVFETIAKNESDLDRSTYNDLHSSKNTEVFDNVYSSKVIALNIVLAAITVPLWVAATLKKKKQLFVLGAITLCSSAVYAVVGVYANAHLEEYFQKANERSEIGQEKITGKIISVSELTCKTENSATCSVVLTIKTTNNVHKVPLAVFRSSLDTRLEVEFIQKTYLSRLTKEKTIEYSIN